MTDSRDDTDQRVVVVDDRHERIGDFALPSIDLAAVDIDQLETQIVDESARQRAAQHRPK